ncbi:hypothetical protein GJ744_009360 [Endocarpon pusillum]|uniref:Uncharacterized protein n=1 Tax=Endocarpon pusillum TaxID=364733 RepID=A0A8H7AJ56_9EURO|nr:hypothetical protein GJ744_009360 [Endocarpon pusillum]
MSKLSQAPSRRRLNTLMNILTAEVVDGYSASETDSTSQLYQTMTVLTLSESMTRNQLEGFSFYQHDVILQQHQMIRDRDYELDAGDAFKDHHAAIIEQQQMILLCREAELAEAQRTLQAQRQMATACTDNMMYLIQMIEERDQTIQDKDWVIASLSNEVRDLRLQRLQKDLEEDQDEEDVAGQSPISPLILPAPALSISSSPVSSLSSSSPSSSSSSPLLPRHHPTHDLSTTRATATRKRDRPAAFNGPIETPRTAEQNGRPSHRSKRARHHNGRRPDHEGSSSSLSPSEESVYPAPDASSELTAEGTASQGLAERLRRAVEQCFLPVPDGF